MMSSHTAHETFPDRRQQHGLLNLTTQNASVLCYEQSKNIDIYMKIDISLLAEGCLFQALSLALRQRCNVFLTVDLS